MQACKRFARVQALRPLTRSPASPAHPLTPEPKVVQFSSDINLVLILN